MASLAVVPSAPHQEALDTFILVRTDEVDQGERLRPIDPVWAQALGQIMRCEGQRTPIEICRLPGRDRWTLVSGGHRLAGAVSADIEYLRAEVVSADRDDRRMREVSENLWRSDLAPIDRAAFVAEAVAIYKRRAGIDPSKDGRVASVTARWKKTLKQEVADTTATIAVVYGWSEEVGSQIGLSERTVRNDLLLYRRLAPSLVERLRSGRHPILTNATQLRTLAKLDEAVQRIAVDRLMQGDTLGEAVAFASGKPKKVAVPEQKRLAAIIGTLKRMTGAERIALCQSALFHQQLPADARALLAPMLRDRA